MHLTRRSRAFSLVELQSSLLLTAAERITRGETAALPELAAANPMGLDLT